MPNPITAAELRKLWARVKDEREHGDMRVERLDLVVMLTQDESVDRIILALKKLEAAEAANPKRWVVGMGGESVLENNHGTLGVVLNGGGGLEAWVRGCCIGNYGMDSAAAKAAVEKAVRP